MKLYNYITFITIILSGTLAQATIFTEDAHIEADDRRYIGQDITVNGCTVTIDGEHSFSSLQIIHGGVITHSPRFTPALHLIIENDVLIDAGSIIDTAGKGYDPGIGPGKGDTGMRYGGGAGHAGAGGQSNNDNGHGALGGTVYGAPEYPSIYGSGGGTGSNYEGGAGGGAIQLSVVGTLTVDGIISVDGNDGDGTMFNWLEGGGGGSGGSIFLEVGTLTGMGLVCANGGNGHKREDLEDRCGGGGGGRITIHCNQNMFWGVLSARGGNGHINGGAGTIFLRCHSDTLGQLYIDNFEHPGATTPLPRGQYDYDSVTILNSATLLIDSDVTLTTPKLQIRNAGNMIVRNAGDINIENLIVSSEGIFILDTPETISNVLIETGGIMSHSAAEGNLDLTVTNDMTIRVGGKLSVEGKGFSSGEGPGKGEAGMRYGGGAGHAGSGGQGNNENNYGAPGGIVYGDPNYPTSYGSGGGAGSNYDGGAGGGLIHLIVGGKLNIDGTISANGNNGDGTMFNWLEGGGGGSGGSIYLSTVTLTGSGLICADGGNGHRRADLQHKCGGGGGGRIAIYTDRNNFFGIVSVDGGNGHEEGEEGTIVYGN